jgi:hypothetical protein
MLKCTHDPQVMLQLSIDAFDCALIPAGEW